VDSVDEPMFRSLLRVARRTAGGHAGAALRLAVEWAWEHPTVLRAIESCVATGGSGLLRRDMLLAHINIVEVQIHPARSGGFGQFGVERRAVFPHGGHDHRELAR